jgi:hypothetical protein
MTSANEKKSGKKGANNCFELPWSEAKEILQAWGCTFQSSPLIKQAKP